MATRKGSIAMSADFSQLDQAVGALQGMTATVRTDRFLVPMTGAVHNRLSGVFDTHMDIVAETNPSRFHHVYEWGISGKPGRLWTHELKGRGSSNRLASWAWKGSKVPIPTPAERAQNPRDPMSSVHPDEVSKLSKRRHVFIWKAPVMEYNQPVTINPKYASMIAFAPTPATGELMFVDSSSIDNPGGPQTTGAFSAEWASWWGQTAPLIFEDTISEEIKAGIERGTEDAVKKGSRKASIGIKTMTQQQAMDQGRHWAARNLQSFATNYSRMSGGDD